jgi:hypothetical protein
LLHPVPPEPEGSTYFSDDSIARRGQEAVDALGDDPAVVVAETARRITELVDVTAGDAALGSPVRTMTLAEYLPSRTAELTVHALDLVSVLDVEVAPPTQALRESLTFMAEVSARRGHGEIVLRALAGRGELPPGFSVY